jgi:hypothetical protein
MFQFIILNYLVFDLFDLTTLNFFLFIHLSIVLKNILFLNFLNVIFINPLILARFIKFTSIANLIILTCVTILHFQLVQFTLILIRMVTIVFIFPISNLIIVMCFTIQHFLLV